MLNISLQIVRNAPNNSPAPTVYAAGDIHNIHDTSTFCDWDGSKFYIREGCNHPRMGFIHIQDVPLTLDFEQLKILLKDSHMGAIIDNQETWLARRVWQFDLSQLSATQATELDETCELTLTWAEAKQMVWHKVAARAITDGDI